MPAIAFTTANFVARETGWSMHGWTHGDRATQEHFRDLETYGERLDEVLARVRELGFDTVDLWGAHLGTDWATDEHLSVAREALARHGVRVATYATWVDPTNVERACELARGIGTRVIGAGFSGEPEALAPVLREHDVRLAVENHPERSPRELLSKIERGGATFGATVDTGWWGTQGYDAPRAIDELAEHVLHVHLKRRTRQCPCSASLSQAPTGHARSLSSRRRSPKGARIARAPSRPRTWSRSWRRSHGRRPPGAPSR